MGMFHRNFQLPKHSQGSNFRYQTRYAQVGCSARARARPRARERVARERNSTLGTMAAARVVQIVRATRIEFEHSALQHTCE